MSFFVQQREVLSTINVILGKLIGPISATTLFGLVFLILVIIGFLLKKKYSWSLSSILVFSLAIAWLPILAQFLYSSALEFDDTWFVVSVPEHEQRTWRYCRIDQAQDLRGGLCNMDSFVEHLHKFIPRGSRVSFLNSIFVPYLYYFNYADYSIEDPRTAQYVIEYRSPASTFSYVKQNLQYMNNGVEESLGQFSVVSALTSDQVIFKRISK